MVASLLIKKFQRQNNQPIETRPNVSIVGSITKFVIIGILFSFGKPFYEVKIFDRTIIYGP